MVKPTRPPTAADPREKISQPPKSRALARLASLSYAAAPRTGGASPCSGGATTLALPTASPTSFVPAAPSFFVSPKVNYEWTVNGVKHEGEAPARLYRVFHHIEDNSPTDENLMFEYGYLWNYESIKEIQAFDEHIDEEILSLMREHPNASYVEGGPNLVLGS